MLKPAHDFGIRPKCSIEGCNNNCQWMGYYRKDGSPVFRKICGTHHGHTMGYLKYRKDYCENKDGRFGFECNSIIRLSRQLETDHIDGNPYNNEPSNLQTLCLMCHVYKTFVLAGDNRTPGRKTLKEYYKNYKE